MAIKSELNISQFEAAIKQARRMMIETPIEPTSALKQAASDNGIPEKMWMKIFINWAYEKWGI